MKRHIMTCLAALALLSAASPSGALARGGQEGGQVTPPDAKVLARVKAARDKNRRVTIKLKNGVSVNGRVGEVRERGFTFVPDDEEGSLLLGGRNAVAAVLYKNVASVRHPSKAKNFFKKVGYGLGMGGAFVIIAPLNGVAILLGGSSIPGCP